MNTRPFALLAATLCAIMPGTASAQASLVTTPSPEAAALGQCLVGKSTGDDRVLFARWMGSSIAMAPAMKDVVTVDPAAKDAIDREMAKLFTRLMTESCRAEMSVLVKAQDAMGVQAASGKLGEMAMRELLQDPAAMQALIAYARYIDPAAMQKLTQ